MIHIINTDESIPMRTLCGLNGSAVYNPMESDCEDCVSRFKLLYPEGYKAWEDKANSGLKKGGNNG